jgi:hypothetical protein
MTFEHPPHHLESGEVAAYLDRALAPEDRLRVEAHLADCEECRTETVAVSRLLGERQRHRRRYLPLGIAAAAALLLVFAPWRLIHQMGDPVLREPAGSAGEAPAAYAPSGSVRGPLTLVWSNVPHADRYRVRVFDRDGTVRWEVQTSDTTIALPDSIRLVPNLPYYWMVSARTGLGRWVASGFTRFTLLADIRPRQ